MSLQALMEELLARTGAIRATLRVDETPGVQFPVRAEALRPGARPLAGDTSFPMRTSPLFAWLERERRILVQEDCREADPAPARTLVDDYGVSAQMVAPVERDGEIVALVSVHDGPGLRRWTDEEVAALEEAVERVRHELSAGVETP